MAVKSSHPLFPTNAALFGVRTSMIVAPVSVTDSGLPSSGECMRLFCPKRTSSVVLFPPSPSWFNQFWKLKGLSLIKGVCPISSRIAPCAKLLICVCRSSSPVQRDCAARTFTIFSVFLWTVANLASTPKVMSGRQNTYPGNLLLRYGASSGAKWDYYTCLLLGRTIPVTEKNGQQKEHDSDRCVGCQHRHLIPVKIC
jgi:hypothetical protein